VAVIDGIEPNQRSEKDANRIRGPITKVTLAREPLFNSSSIEKTANAASS
jgi:hypothetical protein